MSETATANDRLRLIGNRLLACYYEVADIVFMDGSTPWEIDEAMEEFGFEMGPYETQDLTGVDRATSNRKRFAKAGRRTTPLAGRLLELGKTGKKAGAGWYRYPGGGGKVDDPIVADLAIEESYFEKRQRTDYDADAIRERLLFAMVNEACDMLGEAVAQTSAEVDAASVTICGFPARRGGLLTYADTLGAPHIAARIACFAQEDPTVWSVSPLLQECATKQGTLSSR